MPFEVQRDAEGPERSPSYLAVADHLSKDESALTNPMRVLIAEDDSALANFVRKGLEAEHYAVDVTTDGEQARAMAGEMDYDLLMLDLNLPRVDGITILRHLRTRKPSMPILVLTSRKSGGRPSAMPGSRRRRLHGQAIFICRAVGQNPRAAEKEPLT